MYSKRNVNNGYVISHCDGSDIHHRGLIIGGDAATSDYKALTDEELDALGLLNFNLIRAEVENGSPLSMYLWPVQGRTITSKFGTRKAPTAGATTQHRGVDIAAQLGDIIVAPEPGTVTILSHTGLKADGSQYSGGKQLALTSTDGKRLWKFFHLNSIDAKNGPVDRGMVLGTVGQTGVATGPHLHLGLQLVNGAVQQYVDPLTSVAWMTWPIVQGALTALAIPYDFRTGLPSGANLSNGPVLKTVLGNDSNSLAKQWDDYIQAIKQLLI